MSKEDALKLIDDHKNKMINPVEMLHWTWLRVIVLSATEEEWDVLNQRASVILSQ